ncbi:conserved hypothetical protein [Neofusicoccum parvum]|uniref:Uncharacterized protein n=1 Tax=Neofusicoccum parvum TaxID=310453 RepID=A0ACB5S988_9PEZI|nr:conserved hypothetical protein [Neofusicoccum parvum]
MQWILDLRTYGMKIHYNTTTKGHVGWNRQEQLLYQGIQFTMAKFRGMELLFSRHSHKKEHGEMDVPAVPWHSIRDNPAEERRGWSFLRDQRTRLPADGNTWLFNRIMGITAVRKRFTRKNTSSGISRQAVDAYAAQVAEFREKLLLLMHITGGQPARGPEILSIRHSNTAKGGHRNIFVEDGLVVFVTRYHKGYAMSGDVKVIHRYLPREVGELVVWYLWLVLPFHQRMLAAVRGGSQQISAHMWPAEAGEKRWTTERMREAMKKESRIGLGQELTVRAYRDVAIGISRRFMRGSSAFRVDEEGGGENGNEQEQQQQQIEVEGGDRAAAAITDAQAGHTSHTAGLIYARGMMEQAGVVAEKRLLFRASSTDWHRFLGFQSAFKSQEPASRKRKRCPFEDDADEERLDRWARLKRANAKEQLQRLIGKKAEFRSVQEEAVTAIQAGVSPVVAVMPTGAGKSILFMLPAWTEPGGTTVVVVPLIALRADMKERCSKLGISCAEWDARRPPDAESVVLVTPEAALSDEFMTFLNRLRAMRQLDRIVIDECHVVLNDQVDFRK